MNKYKTTSIWMLVGGLLCFGSLHLQAQTPISGRVVDAAGKPIDLAIVRLRSGLDGASTDEQGAFRFETKKPFPLLLLISRMGYQKDSLVVHNAQVAQDLKIVLRENAATELQSLVVSVSSFGVGDLKTKTSLTAMDIYTNPSANADLALGLRQLPGLQHLDDQEGFFMHGGKAEETAIFIEGVQIRHFYGLSNAGLAARSIFPAGCFSGLSLASGGASPSMGGALSGFLNLRLAGSSPSSYYLGLSPLFVSLGRAWRSADKRRYSEHTISYTNLAYLKFFLKPQYRMTGHNYDLSYIGRWVGQASEQTQLKGLMILKQEQSRGISPSPDTADGTIPHTGKDRYGLALLHYSHRLSTERDLSLSGAYSLVERDDQWLYDPAVLPLAVKQLTQFAQVHFRLHRTLRRWQYTYGRDLYALSKNRQAALLSSSATSSQHFSRLQVAAHAEVSYYPWNDTNIALGLRTEKFFSDKGLLALPRLSLSQRLGQHHALTLDVGRYAAYAETFDRYGLLPKRPEEAWQYNLSYEWRRGASQVARLQVYHKTYQHLVHLASAESLMSTGRGYASGLDIFWKGFTLLPNLEQWFSYSYVDSKRSPFIGPLQEERPSYVATHTASVVMKYWVPSISSLFNLSCSYRSGLAFHNPNKPTGERYMNDAVPSNVSVSASYNYPFSRGELNGVVVFSVNNLFNPDPTYAYLYSHRPGPDGLYKSQRLSRPFKQFFMLGLFLNIGVDRRQEILNTNLKLK